MTTFVERRSAPRTRVDLDATATFEAPRRWMVTRFCCTSGMCLTCRAVANGTSRKRIVHADKLAEETAKQMAINWKAYDAKAVPMPPESEP